MPRLLGYRERINTTIYDAFSPKEMVDGKGQTRLFGNRNIGDPALTNMQVAGMMSRDETFP